ncbi:NAD(P)-dependent oxidoreductase [Magnetospirillum sp. 64-120]|uniref:NAD(P)-dependent oxidoreductase n=1 Tax=Magnetospirillum sp. 64-120 TaxID=1895778 RepID=UPI000926F99C|nr:NAD(P)-dependent oxidoreductase [Magnetospirillum sp. 64-120]OJX68340.1 MAG: dehydrogenase [Magnetospirillum sp. 64-120]
MSNATFRKVALVGFGEVGTILAEDLAAQGVTVSAWDLKLRVDPQGAAVQRMVADARRLGVTLCDDPAAALAGVDLAICVVTASQTEAAAQECAPLLPQGAFYMDCNSASPGAKTACAGMVHAAHGRYVESAVMTSVPPYRIKTPMLLGGPWAAEILLPLSALGFDVKVASEDFGVASATKMCRSIMIKGLEAMVIESFTAARAYGVEDAVVQSLIHTFPGIDWEKQGSYFFHRVLLHGRRRAEEMREVARTVREVGLDPFSAQASADRDDWMADMAHEHGLHVKYKDVSDWRAVSDDLLAALTKK